MERKKRKKKYIHLNLFLKITYFLLLIKKYINYFIFYCYYFIGIYIDMCTLIQLVRAINKLFHCCNKRES